MATVIVDWLGRGGISQCSQAWALALAGAGPDTTVAASGSAVTVVTRLGRELQSSQGVNVTGVHSRVHPILDHRHLAVRAAAVIRRDRPHLVVLQNYVLPVLEWIVAEAARAVDARLVVVVHDHQLQRGTAGTRRGLGRILRQADTVVCHSQFVAQGVAGLAAGVPIEVVPHPVVEMARRPVSAPPAVARRSGRRLAVHVGMVGKAYKGTATVLDLAARGVPGWDFAVVGSGARRGGSNAVTVEGFLDPDVLVASVRASDTTLLPYRAATQSGVIPLAQACGSVVIASAVGGIPEQVEDGVTGLLLPGGAGVDEWTEALKLLDEPGRREAIVERARVAVCEGHVQFERRVRDLAA